MSQTESEIQSLPAASDDGELSPLESRDGGLSPDEIFHLLQTNRRRDAMRYLNEHESPVRMRDLAEQVAAWENDTTVQALTSKERQRVYIPLYQTHLPKLDEAGVIEYDQSRGVVERTPLADVLYSYIEGVDVVDRESEGEPTDETAPGESGDPDRDWDGYYTGASGLSIGLVVGSVLGIPVLSTLPGLVIGGLVSALFGLLTLARHLETAAAAPIE